MIKEAIVKAAARENLNYAMAEAVMDEIMSGKASNIRMAAYLAAMAVKGETIEELTASAAGMRKRCIRALHDMDVLEGGKFFASLPVPCFLARDITVYTIGAALALQPFGIDVSSGAGAGPRALDYVRSMKDALGGRRRHAEGL